MLPKLTQRCSEYAYIPVGEVSSQFQDAIGLMIAFCVLTFSATVAKASDRQTLHGHVPPAVAHLKPLQDLPTQSLHLAIALPLRNRETLTNFLHDLYDPANPNFRHYLTPAQFTEKFGPTVENYRALVDFAKSQGLTVSRTYSNRALIDVTGPVASVEKTFHVHLRKYQHPSEARMFYAPDVDPSMDTTVPILEVKGLDDFDLPHPASLHHRAFGKKIAGAKPNGGSGQDGTFLGNDLRAAYVPGVALTGAGQSIGLFELDGYYPNDPVLYASEAGLTNNFAITNVLVDSFDGTPDIYNSEVALDIEMVMAMAPDAQIIVYEGSRLTLGIVLDILNRMAADNAAQQLSSSWQYVAGPALEQAYQQMAAQGQSFFNSSGDLGAYSGKVTQPSDDPNITIVGGTALTTDVNGAWASEVAWSWADIGIGDAASGGGTSTVWTIPTWQQPVNMTTNHGSATMRNLPDVAMVADNVEIIADNGQAEAEAGTSVSTPLWAAFISLVNQQAAIEGKQSVGFINPLIYTIGRGTNYNLAFHDIISGDNTNTASPTNFFAVPGYDLCTGWGSPTPDLIEALVDFQLTPLQGWTPMSLTGNYLSSVASSADGTILAVADSSGSHQIDISFSSGATWRTYGPVANWHGIACSADGSKMEAAMSGGPIYTSTNYGLTWSPTTSSSHQWLTLSSSADGTKLAAGAASEGALWISTDSGGSWTMVGLPGKLSPIPLAWSADGNLLMTSHNGNVLTSTNNGVVWKTNMLSSQALFGVTCVTASRNGSPVYAAGYSNIYVSSNLGTTWSTTTAPLHSWFAIACSGDGTRIIAASEEDRGIIITSSDGGVTWSTNIPSPVLGNQAGAAWTSVACSADGSRWIAVNENSFYPAYTGFFPLRPAILTQPTNQTVQCGLNASLAVQTTGTSPLTYQWYFGANPLSDGNGISGSSSPNLTLSTVALSQNGSYTLDISNPYGSTNSLAATLTVQLTNRPFLNSLALQPDGSVTGMVNGFAGLTYLESSSNLIDWLAVTNFILTNSSAQFTDSPSTNSQRRFYRARVE